MAVSKAFTSQQVSSTILASHNAIHHSHVHSYPEHDKHCPSSYVAWSPYTTHETYMCAHKASIELSRALVSFGGFFGRLKQ